jgi:hypothetical protein
VKITHLSILTVVFSLAFLPGHAAAQTFVEYQHLFSGDDPAATLDAQITLPGTTVKPFVWLLATEEFAEALIGVSRTIRPWFGGGVAAGVETDEDLWRANATFWLAKGRFFGLFINETGASGHWYKVTTTARLNNRTRIGVVGQAFFGWGPLVEVDLGRGFKVWGSVTESPETLVGIRRAF